MQIIKHDQMGDGQNVKKIKIQWREIVENFSLNSEKNAKPGDSQC